MRRHPIRQYDALGMPIDEGAVRGQAMIVQEDHAAPQPAVSSPPPPSEPEASGSRPVFARRSSQSSVGSAAES